MTRRMNSLDIEASGFFALRTPLLPWQELDAWARGLEAPRVLGDGDELSRALAADRRLLRERLLQLIERPEIREALFVAAPALELGIAAWRRDPDSKKGRRAEESLVRYFQRMSTRPTPFGLFSGCSVGEVGSETRLSLVDRDGYRRHTRLDTDYLFALCEDLGRDPAIRRQLRYRPNSSLYSTADRLRYAESRLQGRRRLHHLIAVDVDDHLELVLERAVSGATLSDLAAALVARDPDGEVEPADAREYVHALIDAQILVCDLTPVVTGRESIHDLLDQLSELPAAKAVLDGLAHSRDRLTTLDAAGLGSEPGEYRAVAHRLEELPTDVRLPRLFQVDMIKPAPEATLGPKVLAEIERGLGILRRCVAAAQAAPADDALSRFRESFKERYGEHRAVPLFRALDEEAGLGFGGSNSSDASPLLAGLQLPTSVREPTMAWGRWPKLLLEKLEQAVASGAQEITFSRQDLNAFGDGESLPLPDGFQVVAVLAAESAEAIDRGDFEIYLKNAFGPSGAQLLGRFCHADDSLRRWVEEHLRREEALQPDAIFAEVVHLPEGRIGNILARPVLRDHEIPFLGRSGAASDHQISVADLLVTVSGQEIRLHCASSGRRVIPRLATAHNFSARGLVVYRFLCALQNQGVMSNLGWNWGALESATFLPRVRSGRLVLSRARWMVAADEIRRWLEKRGTERFVAIQDWRSRHRLPRLVALQDGDNELLVDLDNVLSIDTFLAVVKNRPSFTLVEVFPCPGNLCVRGPEGRFVHELVIPYVRRRSRHRATDSPAVRLAARRTFLPGSQWLYAKLYTGTATADRLLSRVVRPIVGRALASGAADSWFFIRYGDPEWHLRLRFHGEPARLQGEVLEMLSQGLSRWRREGSLFRLQLDTYERELERYGGAEGIELSEQLFQIDSEAVIEILDYLKGDEGTVARWQLALAGIDRLLSDLGFDAAAKLKILHRMQSSWALEFRVDSAFRKQLARRLRQNHQQLESLLYDEAAWDGSLASGFAVLDRRSQRLAGIRDRLQALEQAGRLTMPLEDLAMSYVHMFTNRLLRSQGRVHELVLYDYLYRLTRSRAAREGAPRGSGRSLRHA